MHEAQIIGHWAVGFLLLLDNAATFLNLDCDIFFFTSEIRVQTYGRKVQGLF